MVDKKNRLNRHEHGDFVVVTNADKVIFTGKKWEQKLYHWHSGYPGGLRTRNAKDVLVLMFSTLLFH